MKYIILIIAILAQGCSSKNLPATNNSTEVNRYVELSSTNKLSETEIQNIARDYILKKISLSTKRAEQCWNDELTRPKIQEICLILWAAGQDESAYLNQILFNKRNDCRTKLRD